MKVDVVVSMFQGVIDETTVFGDDGEGKAESKALAFLREQTGQEFKTPEDFHAWMQDEIEGECDREFHWYTCPVE